MKKLDLTQAQLMLALALAMLVGVSVDAWKSWQTGSLTWFNTFNYGITSGVLYFLLKPLTQPE